MCVYEGLLAGGPERHEGAARPLRKLGQGSEGLRSLMLTGAERPSRW